MPSALFFLLKITLAAWGLLQFQMNFRIMFTISVKYPRHPFLTTWWHRISGYHYKVPVTSPFLLLLKRKENNGKERKGRNWYPISLQTISPLFQSQFLYPRKTLYGQLMSCLFAFQALLQLLWPVKGYIFPTAWLLCCKRLKTTYSPAYILSQTTDHPDKIFFFFISFFCLPLLLCSFDLEFCDA